MNIWTNGCFDIVHIGHIELFRYASSLGKLFVGIDSDQRVKELKGSDRPVNKQEERAKLLQAIKYIYRVNIFNDTQTLKEIILNYRIDTIVVGDDYINKPVIGSELVKNVIFFPKIPNFSTTNILCQHNNNFIT